MAVKNRPNFDYELAISARERPVRDAAASVERYPPAGDFGTGVIATRICGVDEAGRGPLAGPVVAAAVVISPRLYNLTLMEEIDDSKRLTAARRLSISRRLFELMATAEGVEIAIAAASVNEISRLNILWATMRAMEKAVARLPIAPDHILIDGNKAPRQLKIPYSLLIKGDQLSLSIAAASIIAKVTRDRLMTLIDKRYPNYGFSQNQGYGTAQHREALGTYGMTPHHRRQFCSNFTNRLFSRDSL